MNGGPLVGLTVIELASFISGPDAAMLLADLGADVVKVEPPGTGEPFRAWGERQGAIRPQFAAYNRGKRAVTLDVREPAGREVYLRLAATADVVVENFRPGTADRLGVGYDAIRRTNAGVVYCAVTGMGSSGPYRDRPTYDAIGQAMSGLWSVFTDLREPRPVGPPLSDQLTGLYAAYGILGALYSRERGGEGQRIEVSMLSASIAFMVEPATNYLLTGEIGDAGARPRRSQSYAFVASDGLPLAIHLSSPPKFWEALAQAVGRPDLVRDPRFADKADRVRNYDDLREILGEIFRTRPRAEWLALLERHDVPAAPINNIAEALSDPQVAHLGLVREFGHGERATRLVGSPVTFSATPGDGDLAPPEIGEHNAEVFGRLGYDVDELARLRAQGVV